VGLEEASRSIYVELVQLSNHTGGVRLQQGTHLIKYLRQPARPTEDIAQQRVAAKAADHKVMQETFTCCDRRRRTAG
jgi:hypothetical protein